MALNSSRSSTPSSLRSNSVIISANLLALASRVLTAALMNVERSSALTPPRPRKSNMPNASTTRVSSEKASSGSRAATRRVKSTVPSLTPSSDSTRHRISVRLTRSPSGSEARGLPSGSVPSAASAGLRRRPTTPFTARRTWSPVSVGVGGEGSRAPNSSDAAPRGPSPTAEAKAASPPSPPGAGAPGAAMASQRQSFRAWTSSSQRHLLCLGLKVSCAARASRSVGCSPSRRVATAAMAMRRSFGICRHRLRLCTTALASWCRPVPPTVPWPGAAPGAGGGVPSAPSRSHGCARACCAVQRLSMSGHTSRPTRSRASSETVLQTLPEKSGGRPLQMALTSSPNGKSPESMTYSTTPALHASPAVRPCPDVRGSAASESHRRRNRSGAM
mmetsp:Transcript_53325/g.159089  ORF Transcript_53325/g.159089 Transcript_53325/m.159089 type:complete len:389 (+) Transcript_53325:113-1279(+)